MSIKVMSQVWEHSKHKGSTLLLLLAIADFADDNGMAFPGRDTLADKIRMSERSVQRLRQELYDSGELRYIQGGDKPGARLIVQVTPKGDKLSASDSKGRQTGYARETNRVNKGDKPGTQRETALSPYTPIEPPIEPSIESPDPSTVVEEPVVDAVVSVSVEDDGEPEWWDKVQALCWVCYDHTRPEDLTKEKRGQLTREAKVIFTKQEYTLDELRDWYKIIWLKKDWRGQKQQRPTPSQVRESIAAVRQGDTPEWMESQTTVSEGARMLLETALWGMQESTV